MTFVSTWTDARIERLTALFAKGYSASQIAADLGDATRNGVIGKLHRLKLSRDKPQRVSAPRAPRAKKDRIQTSRQRHIPGTSRFYEAVANPAEIKLRCVEIVPRNVTLTDLEPGDCRYPYGDDVVTFCGHPKMETSSYCVPHFHLCRRHESVSTPQQMTRLADYIERGAA